MRVKGWILDAGVCRDYIELWIKMEDGRTIPALYKYFPSFFAEPKDFFQSKEEAEAMLLQNEHICKIEICKKYTYVSDHNKHDVFRIWVDSPRNFKSVITDVENTDYFHLFNTDIPIPQAFFYETELFPMGLCEFELKNYSPATSPGFLARSKKDRPIIQKITLKDSNEDILYELPPLRIVHMSLGDFGVSEPRGMKSKNRFRRPKLNEPIISCKIRLIDGYEIITEENRRPPWMTKRKNSDEGIEELIITIEEEIETETIVAISKEIERLDPDIILTDFGDEFFFPYLIARASANRIGRDLYLSRDRTPFKYNLFKTSGNSHYFSYGAILHRSKTRFYLVGRIHIDTKSTGSLHFKDGNIFGVVEVARVSRVPIQRLTRITIGGALQSIQFYIAGKKGYLVPPEKKNSEDFQTATTLLHADRGGHIFEPKVGVFELVGEFDFTSLYPMIMVKHNISPDTMNCGCCEENGNKIPDLPFHTCKLRNGIVSEALVLPLKKRVMYKKLGSTLPKKNASKFKKMSAALKWILVVSFGYLGFKNARFGRVECHQSVCAVSREILLRSQEIAENSNFRVLHGIVDSLWLQHNEHPAGIVPDYKDNGHPKLVGVTRFSKSGLNQEELEIFEKNSRQLAEKLRNDSEIPIKLDAIYKFIVFLPSRQHREIPVLNHYWAVTYAGEIKVRGIEIRRRDAPKIVKDAQMDIIKTLSSASGICEFMDFLPLAKKKLDEYCERIDSGKVSGDELTIINRVSKRANEYKVKSYQAIASERLKTRGIEIEPGQKVEYIIRNASSKNPNKRIILRSEFEQHNRIYDKEKYKELLKRAFRNVIPFDYDSIIDYSENLARNGKTNGDIKEGNVKSGIDRYLTNLNT